MKPTDFSKLLPAYLTEHLPGLRNVSPNTIASYCDTFRLLLTYCQNQRGLRIEKIRISDFSAELVKDFLNWLATERHCSASTRNQRLAAIRSFFKFVQSESPQSLTICQNILDVQFSKKTKPLVNYLMANEMQCILAQPDTTNINGRRNLCFICLMYDTGARVSEIISLKVRDVRLGSPAKITLYGKGKKLREAPLLANTSENLRRYLAEQRLDTPDKLDHPLFFNRQRKPLTRTGASYILKKYVAAAGIETRVSPHVLRHTKAMHLLESGINIFYIKGLLGHEDIETTEVYAKANIEMQRNALETHEKAVAIPSAAPPWIRDADTLDWLKNLAKG